MYNTVSANENAPTATFMCNFLILHRRQILIYIHQNVIVCSFIHLLLGKINSGSFMVFKANLYYHHFW
jgi:hypothetical protein